MIPRDSPLNFWPESTLRQRVRGLREEAPPSAIRVYSAATGKLLRIEEPQKPPIRFNNRRINGR